MSFILKQHEYSWVGSEDNYVDEINIHEIQNIVLGRFGGNSAAGQYKNEDGCIIWVSEKLDWEFVVLLDAHQTAESAELVVATIQSLRDEIKNILSLPTKEAFNHLHQLLITTFDSKGFKEACNNIQGETAFLCVVRKENFLWWLSIGDCILYLSHPDLSSLSEYQQNHRSFYEWIGKVNTFDLAVPCYSTGTKELRTGTDHIFLTTDGLVECPNTNFANPKEIFKYFESTTNVVGVRELLDEIRVKNVRDSTTIISWFIDNEFKASQPGNL